MTTSRDPRRGFTLIEVMIALVMLSVIMGSAVALLRSQNRNFAASGRRADVLQNQRFAVSSVERILRTLGSGVAGTQPMLVYGGPDVVAFNADYLEGSSIPARWAVYYNPDADSAATVAWRMSAATAIPNSTYNYPTADYNLPNGAPGPAETTIFYFVPDGSTARGDDFILYQRTNQFTPQEISRNILAFPGRPFFEYMLRREVSGSPTLAVASGGDLPLIRRDLSGATSAADSANRIRPDSVRAIRFNLVVTNGLTGAQEQRRQISTLIEVPNNGLPQPSVCGRRPFAVPLFDAIPDTFPGSGRVRITWTPSPDQNGGEQDVFQYVVYVRRDTVPQLAWDLLLNIRRDTSAVYVQELAQETGVRYQFALAAQDCTPQQSNLMTDTVTAP